MIGSSVDDPQMRDFVANIERVNGLGESSPGFVWRFTDDDNPEGYDPYPGEHVLINISVWEDIESLEHFTFQTFHSDIMRRRMEWFRKAGKASAALWWVETGTVPSLKEAAERLAYLQQHGPSEKAFTFRTRFEPSSPLSWP